MYHLGTEFIVSCIKMLCVETIVVFEQKHSGNFVS